MKMRRIALGVVMLAVVPCLFADADGNTVTKEWGSSPQAYFMTAGERAEWATVRTDEQAAAFVDAFLARRGEAFAAEVAKRAAIADERLTVGKRAGSSTLRGKTIILLGPPAAVAVDDITTADTRRENPLMAGALKSFSHPSGSAGRSDPESTPYGTSLTTARTARHFRFVYNEPKIEVEILVDPATGKDRTATKEQARALEAAFRSAAEASITNK